MSLLTTRWVLVTAIILWFAYECLSPHVRDWVIRYNMHLKFSACLLLCLAVFSIPSLESVLTRHRGIVAHFVHHLHGGTMGAFALDRMREGTRIAEAVNEGGGAPPVLPPSAAVLTPPQTPPAPRSLARLNDIERRTVAARQQWKCRSCLESLDARPQSLIRRECSAAILACRWSP